MAALPKKAAYNVFQQPRRLLFNELRNHIAEHCTNCVETLVCSANVIQSMIIQEDLLNDEDSDSLAKFRARLHNSKTEGNNLRCEEEVNDIRRIILHEGSDNAKRGKSQVFEWARLRRSVEKRIEEEGNVRCGRQISSSPQLAYIPFKNRARVSLCDATHCSRASALHTLFEAAAVSCDGLSSV